MNHLSADEIINLAKRTVNKEPYSPLERDQMLHLRECRECYDVFCGALMVEDMFSSEGSLIMGLHSQKCSAKRERVAGSSGKDEDGLLAVLRVSKGHGDSLEDIIMEQIRQEDAKICFAPVHDDITRGAGGNEARSLRFEDESEAETFVLLDNEEHAMVLQVKLESLNCREVEISICRSGCEDIIIPVKYSAGLAKGIVLDLPNTDFEIRIRRK